MRHRLTQRTRVQGCKEWNRILTLGQVRLHDVGPWGATSRERPRIVPREHEIEGCRHLKAIIAYISATVKQRAEAGFGAAPRGRPGHRTRRRAQLAGGIVLSP